MRQGYLLTALSMLIASMLCAQPEGPDRRPMERIEQWRKIRMIEFLDLTEDQSVRFVARLNEHDKQHQDLMKQKGMVLDRIDQLVKNNAEDKEFEKAFGEIRDANAKVAELNDSFFRGLKDILSTSQRGKFLLFERQFEHQMREAMRELSRKRMHGPGPNE